MIWWHPLLGIALAIYALTVVASWLALSDEDAPTAWWQFAIALIWPLFIVALAVAMEIDAVVDRREMQRHMKSRGEEP